MSFRILINMKSCIPLDVSTLNLDHKINSINFTWNGEDPIPVTFGEKIFAKLNTSLL